jgi:hypothetical protein
MDDDIRDILVRQMKSRGRLYKAYRYLYPYGQIGLWDYTGAVNGQYEWSEDDIVYATKVMNMAATKKDTDEEIATFIRQLNHDRLYRWTREETNLEWLLDSYLAALDRIFFFGVLTNPVRNRIYELCCHGQPWQPAPVQGRHEQWPQGARRIPNLFLSERYVGVARGLWNRLNDDLEITIRNLGNAPVAPMEFVYTMVHELAHTYLDLSTTNRSQAGRFVQIEAAAGHGRAFYNLMFAAFQSLTNWFPGEFHLQNFLLLDVLNRLEMEVIVAQSGNNVPEQSVEQTRQNFENVRQAAQKMEDE